MANKFALIALTLLTGVTSFESRAQNLNGTSASFVTTAVPFLRIDPDARSGAMGDVGIALDADPNAQYWNVGKLPFADKNYGLSMTYTPWLKDLVPDIFLAYLSGYAKFGENGDKVISASMRYFSLGNISYTDGLGNPIGTGMPREYSFDAGYSQKLSPYFSAGLTMRYIHSAIASGVSYVGQGEDYRPGNAFAADLGFFYSKKHEITDEKSRTFNFGAVASNIGSKISYNSTRKDFIPMNLGVGIAYTSQWDAYNKITFAMDVNKLLVPALPNTGVSPDTNITIVNGIFNSFKTGNQIQEINWSWGAEYWYQNTIAFRAGYFYENPNNGDLQYITCGIGVRYNVLLLNASYLVPEGSGTTRNPLSNTVRFSLIFQFNKFDKAPSSPDDDKDDK